MWPLRGNRRVARLICTVVVNGSCRLLLVSIGASSLDGHGHHFLRRIQMHLRRTPVLRGASGFCKSIASAGIFGVLALMAPLASHAQVLTITIFDGTNTLVVTDGSANDSSPASGIVTVDTGLTGPFTLGANSVVTTSFSQTATS